jgi:hypothetical protein
MVCKDNQIRGTKAFDLHILDYKPEKIINKNIVVCCGFNLLYVSCLCYLLNAYLLNIILIH